MSATCKVVGLWLCVNAMIEFFMLRLREHIFCLIARSNNNEHIFYVVSR
jgi:hypothetical protein